MTLQMIIYAKQSSAQIATFAATGTRADIDDLKEDNGGPGNDVELVYALGFTSTSYRGEGCSRVCFKELTSL